MAKKKIFRYMIDSSKVANNKGCESQDLEGTGTSVKYEEKKNIEISMVCEDDKLTERNGNIDDEQSLLMTFKIFNCMF